MLKVSDEKVRKAFEESPDNDSKASRICGLSRAGYQQRKRKLGLVFERPDDKEPISLPQFPDDDISEREIIDTMKKRFTKRQEYQRAKEWFPVEVNMDGPIAVSFFGDPHVDDDGCNWPLLDHHCDLHKSTKGLFAVNIGDSINNWSGRLMRLYAEQETSLKTAKKLARWFLTDSGIDWICWLMGNHDTWTDFPDWLRAHNVARVPMEDWQAQFTLRFPNGRKCRIWAAHDFPGSSMWNSLHSAQKTAHLKQQAEIYAAGHTHNWAMHQEESGSRNFTYWLVRSRGYKFLDHYATLHGHFPQEEGTSVTAVIDPESRTQSGFVQCFAEMDVAVDYLKFMRRKRRA